MPRHPLARRAPAVLLSLALAGCSAGEADRNLVEAEESAAYVEVTPAAMDAPRAVAVPSAPEPPGGIAQALSAGAAAAGPAQAGEAGPRVSAMIIRTGAATVQVDSLEPAVAGVRAMAERLGGYVANASIQTGARQMREARMELKVPSGRFEEALNGLRPLGTVEQVTTGSQDVGEEFVDVSARVANGRRLEERLVGLLASRTGRLEDVLQVERELARVREEIERYEGRLRYLRTRVALSTLTLTLHEPYPVVGEYPGNSPIGMAFREAWQNFVGFTAAFISSLGFLVPLGVLLFAAAWVARRAWSAVRPPRKGEPQPLRIRPRGRDGQPQDEPEDAPAGVP